MFNFIFCSAYPKGHTQDWNNLQPGHDENTSTAFLILCCQARTKLADNLILEKGRGTQVSAPISHTDVHVLKYTYTRQTYQNRTQRKQNKGYQIQQET